MYVQDKELIFTNLIFIVFTIMYKIADSRVKGRG